MDEFIQNILSRRQHHNLDELFNLIFNNGPKAKCSIVLEFETVTSDEIFEILLIISFYGIKRLFDKENILNVTEEEFLSLNEYLAAIGFKCICTVNDTTLDPWTFQKYNYDSNPLKNYHITFDHVYI